MDTQGSRLKKIRTALGLTQDDFAQFFQTSIAYISQIEKDKCTLSLNNLIKLSNNYKVNLNYLLLGIGMPFLPKNNTGLKEEILEEIGRILSAKGI